MPYDGFGARLLPTEHIPYAQHWPGTQATPREIEVRCSCGNWEFFSQASAGGGCDTSWGESWDEHIESDDTHEESV